MRAMLAVMAAIMMPALPAAGQYNQPYGGESQAQAMDEGARTRLREALMFDYAHYRRQRNVGIALGAAGVATYAVGMVFAVLGGATEDNRDGLFSGDALAVGFGLGLALTGMTTHAVGVPLAIVNGVRMGRARRQYMSRLNRSIDYDYQRLKRRVFN